MKLAVLTHDIPNPVKGGSGHWLTVFIDDLATRYELFLIKISGRYPHENDRDYIAQEKSAEQKWREKGVVVIDLEWPIFSEEPSGKHAVFSLPLVRKIIHRLFSFSTLKSRELIRSERLNNILQNTIDKYKVDLLIAAGPVLSIYCFKVKRVKKICIAMEGRHTNCEVNFESNAREKKYSIGKFAFLWIITRLCSIAYRYETVRVLRGFDLVLFSGLHYLRWGLKKNLHNCHHLTLPLSHSENSEEISVYSDSRSTKVILMVGNLHTTSNRSQLALLENEILPALVEELKEFSWQIWVVGDAKYVLDRPGIYSNLTNSKNVNFLGRRADMDTIYRQVDLLLAPVTAPTGPRTKILEAFHYGVPVVAHSRNQLGISELVHLGNCYLGQHSKELCQGVSYLLRNPRLAREMGLNGRSIVRTNYSKVFCNNVLRQHVENLMRST